MLLIRKTTGWENIFFRAPEANVTLVARLFGAVNETDLRAAIKKATAIHPLLRTHIGTDEQNHFSIVENENIEIPLKIIPMISDNQFETTIQEEYNIPFDFEKGPLIRFILLSSSNKSDLIIFCQHMICDGLSLSHLLEEILTLMENPEYPYEVEKNVPLPAPENIDFPKTNNLFSSFVKKVIMNYIYNKWEKTKIEFNHEDFIQIHKSFIKTFHYKIIISELLEEDTDKLLEVCRQNNVTVNSAISVAFLAARKDAINNYRNDIQGVAVSVRNRLKRPVGTAFGCFISDIGFKFSYKQEESFWDNVRAYHKNVRKQMDTCKDLQSLKTISGMDNTFLEALTFARHIDYNSHEFENDKKLSRLILNNNHIAGKLSKEGLKEYPGLLITNLGSLKYSPIYGKVKLEKLIFAPSSVPLPYGGLIIGAVSMNKRLTITLNLMIRNENSDYIDSMNEINNKAIKQILTNI